MTVSRLILAAASAVLLTPFAGALPAVNASTAMQMPTPVKAGDIEISAAFARATLPNAPVGGAYITIVNTGSAPDTLVSATSPFAGAVTLHASSMKGDVMQMRDLPQGMEIPAGGTVTMSPDGLHMMFEHLKQKFVEGQTVPVTLRFAKVGTVNLDVPVLGIAAKGPMQATGI